MTESSGTQDEVGQPGVRQDSFVLGYRPCLDGLRGVAVLLVVLTHLLLPDVTARGAGASFVGVNVFFVLSGFLITSLLVSERQKAGSISLVAFYYRRALRLLPAFATMLVGISVWVTFRGGGDDVLADAIAPVLYVANWTKALGFERPVLFAHTWSLSIEEQFYLLWPLTLRVMLNRGITPASLCRVLVCGIYLVIIERALMVAGGVSFERVFYGTDTRADSLLMGCLLAVVIAFYLPRVRVRRWLISAGGVGGAAVLAYFCLQSDFHRPVPQAALYPLASVAASALLIDIVVSRRSVMGALLAFRPLVWVGKVSYGLYLWHVPIFYLLLKPGAPAENRWVALGLSVLATVLSYHVVEKPFLRLKSRIAPQRTQ